MEKTTKKYVEYLYPGLIVSETSCKEIGHNDPTRVNIEERSIGFRFFDKDFVIDGEEQYAGKVSNITNWFYIGKRLTFTEVQKRFGNNPKYRILIDNMRSNNISSVCMTQYGNFMPMEDGDLTLEEYIAQNSKEKNAIRMFENLKKHIGKEVSYEAWWYGSPENGTGTLKGINYFCNVEIGGMGIPFVGYGSAISSIKLVETGEELYSNPYIEYAYDRRKPEDVEDSKRKMFGDIIVDKQRDRRIKAEKQRKEAIEKADLEAQKNKYRLMKEGLLLVKPETAEDWLEFANNNCNDGYSVFIVKATISMMKKLEAGVSFEEAENQVYSEELGLSGYMASATASALSHFAKNGEEYRKHWNKKYGVDDTEKGTVNPAILTLSPKK